MNRFAITQQQIESNPLRTIGIILYPGVEIIDVVGPMEVFIFANTRLKKEGLTTEPVYRIEVIAKDGQPVTTLSGLQVIPTSTFSEFDEHLDTLIIPGGEIPNIAEQDTDLMAWINAYSNKTRRLASICTGAFVLAKSGLLDGHRVTTHWNYGNRLTEAYPGISVEPDRIFVRDGSIWSSGGITSGIDLALAMLEEDWGHPLALFIAQYLVVYLKRPGGQSQYSAYLSNDAVKRRDIRELQAWIMENLAADLKVETLAERVNMSPRNFARIFIAETGITPAKFVERVRIDLSRHYLENTHLQIAEVAQKVGFNDTETMRRTFIRHVSINPFDYRARFGKRSSDAQTMN